MCTGNNFKLTNAAEEKGDQKKSTVQLQLQLSSSAELRSAQFFGAKSAPDSDDDVPPMLMLQLLLLLLLLWGSASLANF